MIEPKKKKCKGIGNAYGVKGCGVLTLYRKYGLCQSCLADFILHTDKGKLLLDKATLKATKSSRSLKAAEKEKKERKTLGALKSQTQTLVNKYVRLRDKGKPCISSNIPYKSDFDAGHCFPVGSYEGLRYDLDNIHGQSIQANRFDEGDHVNYIINLPNRIGQERFDALLKKAEDYKRFGYKFSRPELLEIQANIKLKIKELNKHN